MISMESILRGMEDVIAMNERDAPRNSCEGTPDGRSDARPSELEAHLGYWLRLVSNHVSQSFARALHERHVSVAEWVALRQLYDRPGLAPGELAQLLGMTPGAVSKILDKLEDKGLVARTSRPHDQRSQALALTSAGHDLLPTLAALADHNDLHAFAPLDTEEQAQLRALLHKLASAHRLHQVPID